VSRWNGINSVLRSLYETKLGQLGLFLCRAARPGQVRSRNPHSTSWRMKRSICSGRWDSRRRRIASWTTMSRLSNQPGSTSASIWRSKLSEILVSRVFTAAAPVRTAKKRLIRECLAAPAGLAGAPKVFLLEGGESAAKSIQNECAVASIMCDVPTLDFSPRFSPASLAVVFGSLPGAQRRMNVCLYGSREIESWLFAHIAASRLRLCKFRR
jgi:hypothetical protein